MSGDLQTEVNNDPVNMMTYPLTSSSKLNIKNSVISTTKSPRTFRSTLKQDSSLSPRLKDAIISSTNALKSSETSPEKVRCKNRLLFPGSDSRIECQAMPVPEGLGQSPPTRPGSCKKKYVYTGVSHTGDKPKCTVSRRNARERNRVKQVSMGFAVLRQHIPFASRKKKLSKVETLRSAVEYIRGLKALLDEASGRPDVPYQPTGDHLPGGGMYQQTTMLDPQILKVPKMEDTYCMPRSANDVIKCEEFEDYDHYESFIIHSPDTAAENTSPSSSYLSDKSPMSVSTCPPPAAYSAESNRMNEQEFIEALSWWQNFGNH